MTRFAIGLIVLFTGGCRAASDTEVRYRQAVIQDPELVGLGFFSHTEPGARRDYTHCDNFTLQQATDLTAIRWWRGVDDTVREDLAILRGFVVEIHRGHQTEPPAATLHRAFVSLADTGPTTTGRRGSGKNETSTALEIIHEALIEPPLHLAAGIEYHLLIAADLVDPGADNWQWADGETFDAITFSSSHRRQAWIRTEDTDSAFELIGR